MVYSSEEAIVLRIAICEDNMNDQQLLKGAIKDWANARNVIVETSCYHDAEAFIAAQPNIAFDLIFLDIEMGKMKGIELAEWIRQTDQSVLIVFLTSYSQYAVAGYEVNALHYLIKPLSQTKLIPVLDKANLFWRDSKKNTLLVSNKLGQHEILLGNIFYFALNSHTAIIHTDTEIFEFRKTLEEIEELLPAHFIRCYRSIIINLLKVQSMRKDGVILSNSVKLPVSRNFSKKVNDAYMRLHMG